ncbi:MAG: hypothetical protein AB1489_28720 [Acidobacteriota bacterium]
MKGSNVSLTLEYVNSAYFKTIWLTITDITNNSVIEQIVEEDGEKTKFTTTTAPDLAGRIISKLLSAGLELIENYKPENGILDGEGFMLKISGNNQVERKVVLINPNYSENSTLIEVTKVLRSLAECSPTSLTDKF